MEFSATLSDNFVFNLCSWKRQNEQEIYHKSACNFLIYKLVFSAATSGTSP